MISYVVMAGGRGERFWPRSRSSLPKQFLSIKDNNSLMQSTVEKLKKIALPQQIYIITDIEYRDIVYKQVPELPRENILLEPCGKDTAAAIGYAAISIYKQNPHSIMVVLPADHAIEGEHEYLRTITLASHIAALQDVIVTIGIKPTRPETGYGYIECGDCCHNGIAYQVSTFREKPDIDMAKKYVEAGNFLWNSGIFVWKVDFILREIEKFLPNHYEGLSELINCVGESEEALRLKLENIYQKLNKISIDYGVLEKSTSTVVVPANFTWDDVGSWLAMDRMLDKDNNNNAVFGPSMIVDTTDCIIYSAGPLVATAGINNMVVVVTEDAVLVCTKEKSTDLKYLVGKIKGSNFQHVL
ncbi:MAG: mannose-1-phosphate guanylyltransferase [Bacillota bacterium]